jgi:hypothetical protein
MSEHEPKETYGVEPEEPAKPAKGKIEAEGLLEDFEEDADFDHDPEVSTALKRPEKKEEKEKEAEAEEEKPFVKPGMGPWRFWASVGALELMAALVLAAVKYSASHPVAHSLLVISKGMLQTGTGVVAVVVGAKVLERKLGSFELAASRMLAAIGALLLVLNLRIDFLTTANLEEWVLGAAAYVCVVWLTFRFTRAELTLVVGAHFVLWVIVELGMQLTRWAATAPGAG